MSNIAERIAVELQLHPEDHAGQPEPADGRGEQLGVFLGRQRQHLAGGARQADRVHVRAEGAGMLVVLAVHVVRDRAAEGHELRSRHDRREPAVRHGHAQQPVERQPGLGAQHAALAVEGHDAVEPVGDDQPPALVQAHIAVGAAHPEAQARPALGRGCGAHLVEKRRPGHFVRHAAQPTP